MDTLIYPICISFFMKLKWQRIVSILNGVVMGVGCGLSTHGRFRVVTERTKLSLLDDALNKVNTSDPAIISAVIDECSEQPPLKERTAYYRLLDIIDRCFSRKTIENVISALEMESMKGADAWIDEALHLMKKASPLILKVFLKSIREGRLQGLRQCLAQEYRISCHGLQVGQDTFEGYRAIFLRKDHTPNWKPSRLELVNDEMVDRYFSKMDDDEWVDLDLPVRSDLSTSIIAKL
ncbi:hypothetical protein C5167_040922 [Papaver somniferum]|uniref:3-hydroxyisobutyryl-CoA hydrolase n=1 Tax=Papaver somniferum TaxID=3469 RepID=A0A4Y7IGD1_PAPSO|nr:hypothetical protein C5167_040922 [Papaver somniferum]